MGSDTGIRWGYGVRSMGSDTGWPDRYFQLAAHSLAPRKRHHKYPCHERHTTSPETVLTTSPLQMPSAANTILSIPAKRSRPVPMPRHRGLQKYRVPIKKLHGRRTSDAMPPDLYPPLVGSVVAPPTRSAPPPSGQ